MSNRLTCPECGNDTFTQQRSMIYDELVVAKFNSRGEVDDEFIEGSECSGEGAAQAYKCKQCGWELVDEDGKPLTEPIKVVAAFEVARLFHQSRSNIPFDPKAHYSKSGEWKGWRHFLDFPAELPICDECGNLECDCAVNDAEKQGKT